MRPATVINAFNGFFNTGPRKLPKPPGPDPDPRPELAGKVVNVAGVLLSTTARFPPARSLFPDGPEGDRAFEAHLDALGKRLRAGIKNKQSQQKRAASYPTKKARPPLYRPAVRFGSPPVRVSWLELRTLSCASCRLALLGPSDESCRNANVNSGHVIALLPAPVAGYVHERPVCKGCLPG